MERLTRLLLLMAENQTKKAEEEKEKIETPIESEQNSNPEDSYAILPWKQMKNEHIIIHIRTAKGVLVTKYFMNIVFKEPIDTLLYTYRCDFHDDDGKHYFEANINLEKLKSHFDSIRIVLIGNRVYTMRTLEISLIKDGRIQRKEIPGVDSKNGIINALRTLFFGNFPLGPAEDEAIKHVRKILEGIQ